MTLWRYFSGGKPQSGEDRIGGGMIGLTPDPLLDARQAFGRLVDVVAIGDVDKGFEEFFETFGASEYGIGRGLGGTASRRARRRLHPLVLPHPSTFPRHCSAATQSPSLAG